MTEFTPQSILEDYQQYITRLPEGLKHLIQDFRDNSLDEAFQSLKDLSDGLTWLVSASDFLRISEMNADFDIEKVTDALNDVNEALMNKDYLLVADILEYELYEYFNSLIQN